MVNRKTWYWLLMAALSLLPLAVGASVIEPLAGQSATFAPDLAAGEDFLYLNPPNSAGISVNKFATFSATSPIKIMNTPTHNAQTGTAIASARLVVIVAPKIQLSSVMDIVGPATDVVFITNDSAGGSIECNACVINNTLRLLLASAYSNSITSEMTALGRINAEGSVTVRSLFAPGSIGLDIVAGRVISSGEININQAAMKSGAGGFSTLPGGQYSIGTGSIDVLSGAFEWDYEARKIIGIGNNSAQYSMGGLFKAPRVYISSSHHLLFDGRVDTRVDAVSAVSYRGETHVPQEAAAIQTLSNGSGSGTSIIMNGSLVSDNSIDIRATKDIIVRPSAKVAGANVKLIAGKVIVNDGDISGALISLAGREVLNEGLVNATLEVDIWADMDLANQYGGVIRGPIIKLGSDKVVRNGSRTPYRTEAANRNNLLSLNSSELLASLDGLFEFDTSSLNSANLGTYYQLPGSLLLVNDGSVEMASDHSAHVLGDKIYIKAAAVENINPYYERVTKQSRVLLNRDRINQVAIHAERLLQIGGVEGSAEDRANYVVNSSAQMVVNSPQGLLRVRSQRFINQRYRVSTYFTKLASSENIDPDNVYVTSITVRGSGYGSATRVYSPPGFLGVMGRMEMDSTQYFANVMGYVEVFNGAGINSANLKNVGLGNKGVMKQTTTTETVFDTDDYGNFSSTTIAKDPTELDSLFTVSGDLDASDADTWFGVLNPFNYFVTQAVKAREDDIYLMIRHNLAVVHPSNCAASEKGCESKRFAENSLEVKVDPEKTLKNIDKDVISFDYQATIEHQYAGYGGVYEDWHQSTAAAGTESLSLMETLEKYYDIVKSNITALIKEFDWWGLAA